MYFLAGSRNAITILVSIFLLFILVGTLRKFIPSVDLDIISKVINFSGAPYYGWFASGALYYTYFRSERKVVLLYAVTIGLISAIILGGSNLDPKIPAILVLLLFTLAVSNKTVQLLLTNPVLLFIGFISYPLYLLHQNIMVSMIIKTGNQLPLLFPILIPVAPIAAIIGLSWVVTARIEPWVREQVLFTIKKIFFVSNKDVR